MPYRDSTGVDTAWLLLTVIVAMPWAIQDLALQKTEFGIPPVIIFLVCVSLWLQSRPDGTRMHLPALIMALLSVSLATTFLLFNSRWQPSLPPADWLPLLALSVLALAHLRRNNWRMIRLGFAVLALTGSLWVFGSVLLESVDGLDQALASRLWSSGLATAAATLYLLQPSLRGLPRSLGIRIIRVPGPWLVAAAVLFLASGLKLLPSSFNLPLVSAAAMIALLALTIDTLDRRRLQDQFAATTLLERDEFFRITPAICCVASTDGVLRQVNPALARLLGCTEQELVGRHITDLTHEDDRQRTREAMECLAAGDRIHGFTNRYVAADGSILNFRWFAELQGELIYAAALDITESWRRDELLEYRVQERTAALETANEELESFAYSVSHDLRTPLRAIAGFGAELERSYRDTLDQRGQDYLRRITAAAARMAALIDDLLALSRLSRAPMNLETVDLSQLAMDVLQETRESSQDRDLRIEVEEGLQAIGDPGLLRILLENLIGNAVKFTRYQTNPRIGMAKQWAGQSSAFCVYDNGVGFDMRYADRLFGAFQRLHQDSEFQGSGIGLATVQRIVSRHGGRVWAEAEPGAGARFYFTLPTPPGMEQAHADPSGG